MLTVVAIVLQLVICLALDQKCSLLPSETVKWSSDGPKHTSATCEKATDKLVKSPGWGVGSMSGIGFSILAMGADDQCSLAVNTVIEILKQGSNDVVVKLDEHDWDYIANTHHHHHITACEVIDALIGVNYKGSLSDLRVALTSTREITDSEFEHTAYKFSFDKMSVSVPYLPTPVDDDCYETETVLFDNFGTVVAERSSTPACKVSFLHEAETSNLCESTQMSYSVDAEENLVSCGEGDRYDATADYIGEYFYQIARNWTAESSTCSSVSSIRYSPGNEWIGPLFLCISVCCVLLVIIDIGGEQETSITTIVCLFACLFFVLFRHGVYSVSAGVPRVFAGVHYNYLYYLYYLRRFPPALFRR